MFRYGLVKGMNRTQASRRTLELEFKGKRKKIYGKTQSNVTQQMLEDIRTTVGRRMRGPPT
jgi:hypothetical protein